jgi:hypothetical protein
MTLALQMGRLAARVGESRATNAPESVTTLRNSAAHPVRAALIRC